MLREFGIVVLIAILVAAAWLWLADAGERVVVEPTAPTDRATPQSAIDDGEWAARNGVQRESSERVFATTSDELGIIEMPIGVEAEPTLVPRKFVVLGPYQAPIVGAVAAFDAVAAPDGPSTFVASVVSDSNGAFTARLIGGALHRIHVEAAGYESKDWFETVGLEPAWWDDVVRLDPLDRAAIEGDVVTPDGKTLPTDVLDLLRAFGDSSGTPLDPRDSTLAARARVVFVPFGVATPVRVKNHSFDVRPQTEMNERGEFKLEPQPSGITGELQLQWCGSVIARTPWTRREGRARLVLDPAQFLASLCTLEIAVTGYAGAVDEKLLTLLVKPYTGCLNFNRRVRCGDDRPLVFARLPAGAYSIAVETTCVLARRRVELEPGKRVVVELDAAVSARLAVIIHGISANDAEGGFQWPSVIDERGDACSPLEPGRNAPLGEFRVALPPGRYAAVFGGDVQTVELSAGASATVEFTWKDFCIAWIELQMPADPERALHEDVQFWLTVERADGIHLKRQFVRMQVDADGKVKWAELLSPGDYRVIVSLDGRDAEAPLHLREGGPEAPVALEFEP